MALVAGKVFDKLEAVKFYGDVRESVELSTEELKNLLSKTNDEIMIRLNNGKLEILDRNRNPIYPVGLQISNTDVFYRYSKKAVEQLISEGGELTNSVEQRQSVLTISNGNMLLEMGIPCPPNCPD